MTQEEKQLLLKDLSARLPYNVLVHIYDIDVCDYDNYLCEDYLGKFRTNSIQIKPYLRSMSSITEEEISDLQKINSQFHFDTFDNSAYVGDTDDGFCSVEEMSNILNYLNSIHVDYRGLIPMNLAIEVNEKNNPYKE